jgi:hypothetical protein
MRRFFILIFCSGCWLSPEEISEKVSYLPDFGEETDTAETGVVEKSTCAITSVEPSYGSNAGGTELAVEVALNGESPLVYIGQKKATVDRIEGNTVYIVTPDTKREGTTPITVETTEEHCTVEDKFRLFEDGHGLVGAYGVFEWHDFQGGYWVDGDSVGSAEFSFIHPVEIHYADNWGETLDECVSNFSPSQVPKLTKYQPEGPAQLNGPNSTLAFGWEVKRNQYEGNLASGDFQSDGSYSLQPIFSDADWPRVEIPGFIETPSPIAITKPIVDDEFLNYISSTSVVLKWDGTLNGDYVIARIWRVVNDNTQEEVRCLLSDDGSHSIDASVWSDWSFQNQYIAIELGRVRVSRAVLPYDLSESGVVGIHWTHGAVWTL